MMSHLPVFALDISLQDRQKAQVVLSSPLLAIQFSSANLAANK
jgi:hypothetical protein